MSNALTPDQLKLARILVETLNLEDIEPEEIVATAPLFGHEPDSLGLDSIDALEIAQAIAVHYDVQIRADDENNKQIFRTLQSLTDHLISQRN